MCFSSWANPESSHSSPCLDGTHSAVLVQENKSPTRCNEAEPLPACRCVSFLSHHSTRFIHYDFGIVYGTSACSLGFLGAVRALFFLPL